MTIYLATDHAGLAHKDAVKAWLMERGGYTVEDCGAHHFDPEDDYPDFIEPAAAAVSRDPSHSRAIIFGGSGQGEAMLANQFPGVRAAVYYGGAPEIITLSREHNDANVLSVGARFVAVPELLPLLERWLATSPSSEAKYARRIEKASQWLRPRVAE